MVVVLAGQTIAFAILCFFKDRELDRADVSAPWLESSSSVSISGVGYSTTRSRIDLSGGNYVFEFTCNSCDGYEVELVEQLGDSSPVTIETNDGTEGSRPFTVADVFLFQAHVEAKGCWTLEVRQSS